MQFSEDELRSALRRKDPGPEFTQRVIHRLNNPEAAKGVNAKPVEAERWNWWKLLAKRLAEAGWRPVMAGAMAGAMAIVLVGFAAWMGIERYQSYMQQVQNRTVQEEKVARQAEEQAVRALRITSAKLNHVFQKVNGVPSTEPKIRRQTL
jgi:hypothetical protein